MLSTFFFQLFHFCFAIVYSQEKREWGGICMCVYTYIHTHQASIGLVLPLWGKPIPFSLVSKATHIHASILFEVISSHKCVCQFQGSTLRASRGRKRAPNLIFYRFYSKSERVQVYTCWAQREKNKSNRSTRGSHFSKAGPGLLAWCKQPWLGSGFGTAIFPPWMAPPAAKSPFVCKLGEGTRWPLRSLGVLTF